VHRELDGLGGGPSDRQQDVAVEDLLMNGGGMVLGSGGTGKSTVLCRLKEALEARGEEVHIIAFNELHSNVKRKRVCLLIDESSMVSRKMWAQLARYRFTGSKIFLFGDPVQFGAIQDQGKGPLDFSHPFFWRLCNGLQVHLNRFRRGGDQGHFNFVWDRFISSTTRRWATRWRGLARGTPSAASRSVLCVSHAARVRFNAMSRVPQNMRVWAGVVLVAVCSSTHRALKNGLHYRVEELGESLMLRARGEPFVLAFDEVAKDLRLTHALCYFSIYGPTRLAQTSHPRFEMMHLIVGLGHGPTGSDIEVE
jgi:hypothetical protein